MLIVFHGISDKDGCSSISKVGMPVNSPRANSPPTNSPPVILYASHAIAGLV